MADESTVSPADAEKMRKVLQERRDAAAAEAKKVGVSQSVGKDFNAADKGKTFAKGGITQQKINKQNTRHGMMNLPVAYLSRFSGMKKGGVMKKRHFYEGGDEGMENDGYEKIGEGEDAVYRKSFATGVTASNETPAPKKTAQPAAAPFTRSRTPSESDAFETTLAKGAKKRAEVEAEKTSAPRMGPMRGGRVKDEDGVSRYASEYISPERKKEIAKDLAIAAVTSVPVARAAQLTYRGVQGVRAARAAAKARDLNTPMRELLSERRAAGFPGHKSGGKIMGFKKGGMANFEKSGKDVEKKGMKEGSKADIALDKKQMMGMNMGGMTRKFGKGGMPMKDGKPAFLKKMMGGGMSYAKGGMHTMPDGKMMKDSAMKKKMMGGGMAKYAHGGGIESRGKTKGTIIRMASGGSVSSASRRADGIAQRGKTRC